jgi:cell division protein FtsI (penicillin-binding protein 3)
LDSLSQKNEKSFVSSSATTSNAYRQLFHALGKPLEATADNRIARLVTDSNEHISVVPEKMYYGIVPDVTGLSLKDAVYLLENEGLSVFVVGRGRIQTQSVAPGTTVMKGQEIVLQLS